MSAKMELKYWFNNQEFEKVGENSKIMLFINRDSDELIICDVEGNIQATVSADTGQNMGYLFVNKVEN